MVVCVNHHNVCNFSGKDSHLNLSITHLIQLQPISTIMLSAFLNMFWTMYKYQQSVPFQQHSSEHFFSSSSIICTFLHRALPTLGQNEACTKKKPPGSRNIQNSKLTQDATAPKPQYWPQQTPSYKHVQHMAAYTDAWPRLELVSRLILGLLLVLCIDFCSFVVPWQFSGTSRI